jgi:hypothetical protein
MPYYSPRNRLIEMRARQREAGRSSDQTLTQALEKLRISIVERNEERKHEQETCRDQSEKR